MSRVNQIIRDMENYRKRKPIEKRCKCGCREKYLTKQKISKFKNHEHYINFKIKHGIKKTWHRRFKVQKNATHISQVQ